MEDPDYDEILDIIFDDEISEILAEMEDSPKTSSELSEKFHISEDQLEEKLSNLIRQGFVEKKLENDDIIYSVDGEKLSKILEGGDNFKNIDDGLAKMDSFLN